ncbi:hypothetical protein II906_02715 [bacterium]|nr:hypothetical protein [bacterium]
MPFLNFRKVMELAADNAKIKMDFKTKNKLNLEEPKTTMALGEEGGYQAESAYIDDKNSGKKLIKSGTFIHIEPIKAGHIEPRYTTMALGEEGGKPYIPIWSIGDLHKNEIIDADDNSDVDFDDDEIFGEDMENSDIDDDDVDFDEDYDEDFDEDIDNYDNDYDGEEISDYDIEKLPFEKIDLRNTYTTMALGEEGGGFDLYKFATVDEITSNVAAWTDNSSEFAIEANVIEPISSNEVTAVFNADDSSVLEV